MNIDDIEEMIRSAPGEFVIIEGVSNHGTKIPTLVYMPAANMELYTRPDSYVGEHYDGYYVAPFGKHRDSDLLTQSNYNVVIEALRELDQLVDDSEDTAWGIWLQSTMNDVGLPDEIDSDGTFAPRYILEEGGTQEGEEHGAWCNPCHNHWAVGYVEPIFVSRWAPFHLMLLDTLCAKYEDYPVLDDDDHSAFQQEDIDKAWSSWLSWDFKQEFKDKSGVDITFIDDDVAERLCNEMIEASDAQWEEDSGGMAIDVERVVEVWAKLIGDEVAADFNAPTPRGHLMHWGDLAVYLGGELDEEDEDEPVEAPEVPGEDS